MKITIVDFGGRPNKNSVNDILDKNDQIVEKYPPWMKQLLKKG